MHSYVRQRQLLELFVIEEKKFVLPHIFVAMPYVQITPTSLVPLYIHTTCGYPHYANISRYMHTPCASATRLTLNWFELALLIFCIITTCLLTTQSCTQDTSAYKFGLVHKYRYTCVCILCTKGMNSKDIYISATVCILCTCRIST